MTVQTLKLADCITLTKGKPPVEAPYFGDDAEPYLSPEYLRGRGIAEPAKPAANAVRVKNGETILLWDGSNAGEFFRARAGLLTSTMTLIRHSEEFEPEYFCYATKRWEAYLKGQTSGSGIPHVDKEVLGKLEILQLPPDEQKLVAHILAKLDRAIEQTEAFIAKQQRIKTGLMQDLLTKGIDAHGNIRTEATHAFKDSPLGRIPLEWEAIPLGKLAPLQRGYDIVESEFVVGDYPVISSSGIIGFHNKATTPGPNVVVGRKGSIGNVHFVETDFWAHDTSLFVTNFYDNDEKFVFYLFSHMNLGQFGTKSGSPSLNRNDIHPILIGRPNPAEQGEIVDRLSIQDSLLSQLLTQSSKLLHIKRGLMHDLLTGERRVTPLLAQAATP